MKNAFILLIISLSSILVFAQSEHDPFLFSPKGIAKVYLEVENTIERDVKQTARMRIVNSDDTAYDKEELYEGRIEIEGRGNSTWGMPKKPYNIDLITSRGDDNIVGLLGMPASAEWTLIANYADKSLLRIPLAYNLGSMIGMEWTPRLRFVEVYLNNNYDGLYCLCEKVSRASNRIDVKKPTDADPNGGYIIEVTPDNRIEASDVSFNTPQGTIFVMKYPKSKT